MQIEVFATNDHKDLSKELLNEDGSLKLLPASFYRELKWQDFRIFCHKYGRYGIPTTELIEFLTNILGSKRSIEIGAGAGDLGLYLGNIPMTDNRQQEWPSIALHYKAMGQPVIKYPKSVEKLDALDAVKKYEPDVVIGSWITTFAPHEMPYGSNPHGIKEPEILDLVDTFIIIGNLDTHGDKPILKLAHEEYYFDWLVSRGKHQENNRIWIWNKK